MSVARSLFAFTRAGASIAVGVGALAAPLRAQTPPTTPAIARLVAEPARITMKAGQTMPFKVTAYDAQGKEVPNAMVRVTGPRMAVRFGDGEVRALKAGSYTAVATGGGGFGRGNDAQVVTLEIPVLITWPALSRLEIAPEPGRLYVGTLLSHSAKGVHDDGTTRTDVAVTWRSNNPSVASVDRFGNVKGLKPGPVTISAEAEGVLAQQRHIVAANPVSKIDIEIKETTINTGDVIRLAGTPRRANGTPVADAKIAWSYIYTPDDTTAGPGGPAIIDHVIDRDVFTANAPGRFQILANAGSASASTILEVKPRDVRRRISITGRGTISNTHTSDLWPWTGKDGRDYVLVGTWGGDGYAMVFDITNMNSIVKTDSVKVDARTINDVTVSPDGRYGVLSREGASNRVNGVVILDLANPAHPKIASTFDQELTGGVHNVFATNDHLFAISGGQKYVIIDVKDIYKPKYVSEYKHPNARIHDLWVRDGIAYSAQGGVGTVVVDVGNGKYGGTIEKPKLITVFPINSGHEIYPYFQKATGKTYLFIGDEEMNRAGRVWEGTNYRTSMYESGGVAQTSGGYTHIVDFTDPMRPKKVGRYHLEDYGSHDIIVEDEEMNRAGRVWEGTNYRTSMYESGGVAQTSGGYTHIVDFTDPMRPKKVGRYHLEDYGSHDIIVEDDVLYQAYYDGGVRVVDVSGELLGNLAEQRREIAVFKPYDPKGFTANAPFVMNAMPWKGQVLFTDFNSGLWAAKLEPKQPVTP